VLARMPFRGTLLNTLTVVVGSLIGLGVGELVQEDLKTVALSGIGLIVACMGVKMFLDTKNVLIPTIAVVSGGLLGAWIGIDVGLANFAEWLRGSLGGGDTFNEGLVSASVLFCVGPLTLLGCVKDGLYRDIELLSFKSLLDGTAAVFFAAALGAGVLASALVVLVVQGLITAFAKPLRPLAERPQLAAEATAAGGAIMLAIAISLLGIRDDMRTETYLPALAIAPLVAPLFLKKEQMGTVTELP
jgi:uncharacterized membrane protein YqgA involved in biofilm formation